MGTEPSALPTAEDAVGHGAALIRRGVAGIAAQDRRGWSDAALAAEVAELTAAAERVRAELVRLVGEWDARNAWADDLAATPAAWLVERAGMPRRDARRLVWSGRLVHQHDATASALASGDVSAAHVEVLASVAHDRGDLYRDHEPVLLRAAVALVPDDLVVVTRRWRVLADDELARADAVAAFERRHLHVSKTTAGGVLDGFLDASATATVLAALDSLEPPDSTVGPEAPRTLSQRRADALVALCGESLGRNERGGRAPVGIDFLVDAGTGLGEPVADVLGARCDLDRFGPVSRTVFERLACDAAVGRIVMRGKSEVLEVGRRTRVVNRAMRRALAARDAHCQFPGCRVPAAWCDAHHIVHWIAGGPTCLDNLLLLCRRHHVAAHEGRWRPMREPAGERPPEPATNRSVDSVQGPLGTVAPTHRTVLEPVPLMPSGARRVKRE